MGGLDVTGGILSSMQHVAPIVVDVTSSPFLVPLGIVVIAMVGKWILNDCIEPASVRYFVSGAC